MSLDYNSLLLAIGFSAACLAITLFGSWIAARTEKFLLTWTLGVVCIVGTVFTYSAYGENPDPLFLLSSYILLVGGLAIVFGAAFQFRTGRSPISRCVLGTVVPVAIAIPAFVLGVNAVALIIMNIAAMGLLFATGREYWRGRDEAPGPILALASLYSVTGCSFGLCAAVLMSNGEAVIARAPQNWAENLNLAVCIAGLSGIGALSLALNQWRLARHHERDARTDSLTGLLNRRALFDRYARLDFRPSMAVVLFDLDSFKSVNDKYGHAVGDAVLKVFAEEMNRHCRPADAAARLGGEEFAMVLDPALPGAAERTAERIRADFARREIATEQGGLFCTVSAGVAFGDDSGKTFETVLGTADKALYAAKNDGRNRIVVSSYLRAV